jgi:hypothetical protein
MTDSQQDRHRFIKVATAQNEAQAQFIQGLLREEGVPSLVRRTAGSDVPGLLAAGPRDVLVAECLKEVAGDVLLQSQTEPFVPTPPRTVTRSHRLLTNLLVALALLAILAWCATELFV